MNSSDGVGPRMPNGCRRDHRNSTPPATSAASADHHNSNETSTPSEQHADGMPSLPFQALVIFRPRTLLVFVVLGYGAMG